MSAKSSQTSPLMKYGTYTILALLVITFIGAPIISNNFGALDPLVFGKYGVEEIKYEPNNYFGRLVQGTLQQYEEQYPEMVNNNFIISTVWKQSFDQTVIQLGLLDLAKQANYSPSNSFIKDIITTYPDLQENGQFSPELYNTLSDTTKQTLLQNQKEETTSLKVYSDILFPSLISTNELQLLTNMNNVTRSFSFVRFDKYTTQDETLLQNYGKDHPDLFKYIEYKSITLGSQSEADTVYQNITNQETTFNEAVTAFSIDSAKEDDGNRGGMYAYQIEKSDGQDTLDALLLLTDTNTITEPIETSTGNFAIYQLSKEIQDPDFSTASLPDSNEDNNSTDTELSLLEEVENYLSAYDPGVIEDAVTNTAESFIVEAQQSGFSYTATTFNLELGTIPNAPLNINNIDLFDTIKDDSDSPMTELASSEDVLSNLFSLQESEISLPFVIGGFIYVFQITDTTETDITSDITLEDRTRITNFVKTVNDTSIKEAVVDENKFTDNFDNAFRQLYPNP